MSISAWSYAVSYHVDENGMTIKHSPTSFCLLRMSFYLSLSSSFAASWRLKLKILSKRENEFQLNLLGKNWFFVISFQDMAGSYFCIEFKVSRLTYRIALLNNTLKFLNINKCMYFFLNFTFKIYCILCIQYLFPLGYTWPVFKYSIDLFRFSLLLWKLYPANMLFTTK